MRIRLHTTMASAKGTFQEGAIIDMPQDEAMTLIENGYAAPEKTETVEEAIITPPEKAAMRKTKRV